jgi:transposase
MPTAAYRMALRQALQTPPGQFGYGFSVWSVARVGQHLKNTPEVGFSTDHLRRLVHAEGFSFQRPKPTLKGKRDETAYASARQELQDWGKKLSPRKRTLC